MIIAWGPVGGDCFGEALSLFWSILGSRLERPDRQHQQHSDDLPPGLGLSGCSEEVGLSHAAYPLQALSDLQKAALKVVKEGSTPDLSDLGQEALLDIERVKTLGDPKICSRCHWQSGCPSCDVWKCERYHLRVLCRSLGQKPPEWAH